MPPKKRAAAKKSDPAAAAALPTHKGGSKAKAEPEEDDKAAAVDAVKAEGDDEQDAAIADNVPGVAPVAAPPKRKARGKAKAEPDDGSNHTSDDAVKTEDADGQRPPKKVKTEDVTDPKKLHVPVDEGADPRGGYKVLVDDGVVWDAALNQTNAGSNANKFYRLQLHEMGPSGGFQCWTRWGRVGEYGQKAALLGHNLEDAKKIFQKKFKDKTGLTWDSRLDQPRKGKYAFIERSYDDDDDYNDGKDEGTDGQLEAAVRKAKHADIEEAAEYKSYLPEQVQHLMRLIFNQDFFSATMVALNYDANKLPLGKLSKRTITQGMQALKDLAAVMNNPSIALTVHNTGYGDAIQEISNSYYSIVPHAFGRNRPPVIGNDDMLKKEIELLDSLSDMSIADEIMEHASKGASGKQSAGHRLEEQFRRLDLKEMEPLDHQTQEFQQLEDYLIKTHGQTHYMAMRVEEIFRIERIGEEERFKSSTFGRLAKNSDRRLLWHGSRCTNFGGILSQGLRIAPPEAPVNGYMFGKGVYLADISSKSAGYCSHHQSGNTALLLLCDAELGKPMFEPQGADSEGAENAKRGGHHSTWGKGSMVPSGWKDASCVNEDLRGVTMPDTTKPPTQATWETSYLQYNEYIAYDVAQIRLRYLFRVNIT